MARKFKSFETRDKPRKRGPGQHKKSKSNQKNYNKKILGTKAVADENN